MIRADQCMSIVEKYFADIMNHPAPTGAFEYLNPDFVVHHPAFPQGLRGLSQVLGVMGGFRAAFPDLKYSILDHVVQENKAAIRWSASGTHKGEFLNMPASGRPIFVTGIDFFWFREGQITEAWVNSDFLGLMQQIGAIPGPGA
jgi:steroid delta-isomerase-like uncharacterized protein